MSFDRKTYKEVKTAIKNGALLPDDNGVKFSYKGTVYILKSCYQVRSNDIEVVLGDDAKKESVLAKWVKNLKDNLDWSAYYTNVQIQDYPAKANGIKPKEVRYTGLRDFALCCMMRKRCR